ncbi:hypothetical protein EsH8_IV_000892 [Colletotrichum jinshuiense]
MSSSLARTRSLRKPTQGSSTDLPPASTSSASATASTAPASSAEGGGGAAAPLQRPSSPSRLPGPRSLVAPRPTTRSVSGASVASVASNPDAAKKKRSNPISSLFGRNGSTRQTAAAATTTRQKDAAASGAAGSGPSSAPSTRPTSMSGLTRTSSMREPGLTRTRYPPSSVSMSTVSHAGAGAGTTSTSTTSRPTTSAGLSAPKRSSTTSTATTASSKGHARAKSVATLNGSTVLRPPSQTSTSSGGNAPARPRPTSLYGAPSSTAAPKPRPTSVIDRLTSKPSLSSLSSTSTASKSSRTATAPAPAKQPQKQPPQLSRQQQASPTSPPRNKPLLRPAFSTLQQHYSPAKSQAPKPLTATYLAPPSPSKLPTNVALSAETSRLQTELLQLHLLHRELPSVTSQWHASARAKLADRHAALGKSSKDLAALEADAAERLNVAALHRWAAASASPTKGGRGRSLEDKIQRLDALVTFLWSLDSPGGKHHRLVRTFERWASSLSDLEAARARAEDARDPSALLDPNLEVRFGGGLDDRWKEESSALVRRLEGWNAQLRDFDYVDDHGDGDGDGEGKATQVPSLKRMLDGCRSLIRDMLDELAVMEQIEAAAVERETEWIRMMNREGDDGRGKDTPRAGAVWRVV